MFACLAAPQVGQAGARDGVGEHADWVDLKPFEGGGLARHARNVAAHRLALGMQLRPWRRRWARPWSALPGSLLTVPPPPHRADEGGATAVRRAQDVSVQHLRFTEVHMDPPGRLCLCARCRAQVVLCSRCDRGTQQHAAATRGRHTRQTRRLPPGEGRAGPSAAWPGPCRQRLWGRPWPARFAGVLRRVQAPRRPGRVRPRADRARSLVRCQQRRPVRPGGPRAASSRWMGREWQACPREQRGWAVQSRLDANRVLAAMVQKDVAVRLREAARQRRFPARRAASMVRVNSMCLKVPRSLVAKFAPVHSLSMLAALRTATR